MEKGILVFVKSIYSWKLFLGVMFCRDLTIKYNDTIIKLLDYLSIKIIKISI